MFNLDLRVFEFKYNKCTSQGNTIGVHYNTKDNRLINLES